MRQREKMSFTWALSFDLGTQTNPHDWVIEREIEGEPFMQNLQLYITLEIKTSKKVQTLKLRWTIHQNVKRKDFHNFLFPHQSVYNLFCWINQKSYSPFFLSSQVSILNQEREWERCSRWVVALMAEQYRLYLLPSSSVAFFFLYLCLLAKCHPLYRFFFSFSLWWGQKRLALQPLSAVGSDVSIVVLDVKLQLLWAARLGSAHFNL